MQMKPKGSTRRRRVTRARSEPERAGQIQSLSRAFAIINALARDEDGLSMTDVAHTVGLPTSTTHRMLTSLEQERFVRFDRELSRWAIGVQAFIVGSAFLHSRDVVALGRPYLHRLMEEGGETANLALEDEGQAVYMGQVESRHMVRAIGKPGGRVYMHNSALGKAILAVRPAEDVSRILQKSGLPRFTDRSIDTPAKLRAHLETVRARGYAIDDEEYAVGLRCVAAPVFDEAGTAIAAVSLSGPIARITDARLPVLGTLVEKVAGQITADFGGCSPPKVA